MLGAPSPTGRARQPRQPRRRAPRHLLSHLLSSFSASNAMPLVLKAGRTISFASPTSSSPSVAGPSAPSCCCSACFRCLRWRCCPARTGLPPPSSCLSVRLMPGAPHPWLPSVLRQTRLPRVGVRHACGVLRPLGQTHRRMCEATPDGSHRSALRQRRRPPACSGRAFAVFPLGLLPLAPFAPSLAITVIGLGLFIKDGVAMLAGAAIVAGALMLAARIFG